MEKNFFYLVFLCVTLSFSQSKTFKISGTLISDDENLPLESATVYIERIKDSALVNYTITDKKGLFTLEDKTVDMQLNLLISYVGYETYSKTIKIDRPEINLGKIIMQIDANALDEIVIKSRAPITIKKDTLEFNVKSFKTKKDANVEDLLKVLPGIEVDEEGVITVNGRPVNRILVNGKPFFGNDPTITTRNLTKDVIEKIQVVDTKTKSQAFSGEEGDDENKTINLTIKEENNKGVFGRASAGTGTDERYEFAGMFNRFDNDQRFSVLVGGNNINSPGFSFGEIRKMFGGGNSMNFNGGGAFQIGGRSFGGGQGITTSNNVGANFADKFGEKVDLSTDYFYSGSSSENVTSTQRENILPDSRFFTNSESRSFSDNDNHSANMEFDMKIDSTFLINIEPSFRHTRSKTVFSRDEDSRDELNALINESNTESVVETVGKNFTNDIQVTKRFGSNGAYLRLNIDNEISSRESDDFLFSKTDIYGDNPDEIIRDQFTRGNNKVNDLRTSINYNIPLIAKELFLNFGYGYSRNKQEDKQSTLDKDVNGDYTVFNTELSTDFEYINEILTPEFSIRYRNKKWSARFNTSYLFRNLENKDLLRPEFTIKRKFEAVELRSNFRYRFSPKSSIRIGYGLNNSPPQLRQLQAFQNVSNPLNTIVGNPNLEPTNNHRVDLSYNAFDFQKGTGFYSYFNVSFINNQVVSNTTIDENFVRETTYSNVNGNYRINGNLNYNKSVKLDSLRTLRLAIGINGNKNRNINYNNGVQYASHITGLSPSVNFMFTWKDVMEFMPRYQINFTKNTFDITSFEDREFLFHSLHLSTATFLPKHFEWRNEMQYNYNPNIAEGFQKSSWFWNATLAYSFMKDKSTITFKAYDLLNQNTNARRTANQNFIQDSQSTVLQQYFMLSFSWKFNSLGQKGEIREGGFHVF
ncbi:outer membrane beta-barrel protein [Flavivirga amylovorans]|uniref:Outer membrane beta-barrel protein n=1 Tax=Flavivirga amylovorans TaxID=870486 RepID=A0ABT8X7Q1_9FLAO|nr:outer membrane beta-barrel protein [Flavivirga amylovorans]MDO5989559.1 outer membrane beta-barrel protein [Flavivirga amylovorans]